MLTNLLKDRFRMATHTETREMPVYNLVFARNDKRFGPAFKESSAECRAGRIGPMNANRCASIPAARPVSAASGWT